MMGIIPRHFGPDDEPTTPAAPEISRSDTEQANHRAEDRELAERYGEEWSAGEILFQTETFRSDERLTTDQMRERVNLSRQVIDGGSLAAFELNGVQARAAADYIRGSRVRGMNDEQIREELQALRQLLAPVDHGEPDAS